MNGCPLNTWGQNSRCTHAVSATPEGPYAFADVAVTNWCHNPAIIVKGSVWALFHIGDGTGGATKNCTKAEPQMKAFGGARDVASASAAGSTLHTAPGPNGPWTPASPLPSCNNPAPFLARNGSVFVVCDGFTLYRADDLSASGATWKMVTSIHASGSPISGNYEVCESGVRWLRHSLVLCGVLHSSCALHIDPSLSTCRIPSCTSTPAVTSTLSTT